MLELLGAKAAVCSGRLHYGTAFGEGAGLADNVDAISRTLVRGCARLQLGSRRQHPVHAIVLLEALIQHACQQRRLTAYSVRCFPTAAKARRARRCATASATAARTC